MINHRFTDEEIVKALECCLCDNLECSQCQNKELDRIERDELATKIIDLINRQRSEIERLRAKVETRTQEKLALGRIYTQKLKTIKYETYYEAYKEFAERIRECYDLNDELSTDAWLSVTADIDRALKEMSGENNV